MKSRFLSYSIVFILSVFLFQSCGVKKSQKDLPDLSVYKLSDSPRININDTLRFKGTNSLRKNSYGQWELVASGNPYDLGNTIGVLSEDLIKDQEEIFLSEVDSLVPSKRKQYFLRKFLAWYNRKMYKYVKEEYKAEIYGVSQYSSDDYDLLGSKYLKSLYLHGAHDIGHALQDLAMVGCSSFAVWGDNSADGNLLIARNFDFYAGDEFAQNKMISFINPDTGYKFVAVSWAGMIGVMSGMNDQGLTVTINAGKSDIPLVAKTPISLVTREVLQYASNIEEAIKIAKQREVFVSESILVGSAKDNKAVIIEMSPDHFDVYDANNSSKLICSNHFQSKTYKDDKANVKHIAESHSQYRFDRMEELLGKQSKITPQIAVDILRNREGLNDLSIGYGNEKALNQLLAHHGIVFQPENKKVWISAQPYQLGEFVAFQLDSVFLNLENKTSSFSLETSLIKKDSFVESQLYANYERYRNERKQLIQAIETENILSEDEIVQFVNLNPEFWEVYYLIGTYYYNLKDFQKSYNYFNIAKTKEVTTIPDLEAIEKYIKKLKRKL